MCKDYIKNTGGNGKYNPFTSLAFPGTSSLPWSFAHPVALSDVHINYLNKTVVPVDNEIEQVLGVHKFTTLNAKCGGFSLIRLKS